MYLKNVLFTKECLAFLPLFLMPGKFSLTTGLVDCHLMQTEVEDRMPSRLLRVAL